jgi:hypothetical protein
MISEHSKLVPEVPRSPVEASARGTVSMNRAQLKLLKTTVPTLYRVVYQQARELGAPRHLAAYVAARRALGAAGAVLRPRQRS